MDSSQLLILEHLSQIVAMMSVEINPLMVAKQHYTILPSKNIFERQLTRNYEKLLSKKLLRSNL